MITKLKRPADRCVRRIYSALCFLKSRAACLSQLAEVSKGPVPLRTLVFLQQIVKGILILPLRRPGSFCHSLLGAVLALERTAGVFYSPKQTMKRE